VHGKWYWQARPSYKGRRKSRLCDTQEEAKRVKAELLMQLMEEVREEGRITENPDTLELLCDAYMADLERRGKAEDSIRGVKTTKKRLEEFFGQRMKEPLDLLTEADLFAFKAHYARTGSKPSTINHDLANIHTMLKLFAPHFSFPKGIFFPQDVTRVRYLTPDQMARVMSLLPSPFREIAQFAALTLMRLTEILRLRRDQVSLQQGVIVLPRTKTGPGTVVLSTEAQRLLQAQLESHHNPWVFPSPKTGLPYSRSCVSAKWHKATIEAGLEDFHFHDLRHHGATMALNAGFASPIVMALGRWSSERVMRRYAAVTDTTLRAAAEAVSRNGRVARPNA
jgi:integrase